MARFLTFSCCSSLLSLIKCFHTNLITLNHRGSLHLIFFAFISSFFLLFSCCVCHFSCPCHLSTPPCLSLFNSLSHHLSFIVVLFYPFVSFSPLYSCSLPFFNSLYFIAVIFGILPLLPTLVSFLSFHCFSYLPLTLLSSFYSFPHVLYLGHILGSSSECLS